MWRPSVTLRAVWVERWGPKPDGSRLKREFGNSKHRRCLQAVLLAKGAENRALAGGRGGQERVFLRSEKKS